MILLHTLSAIAFLVWGVSADSVAVSLGTMACGITSLYCAIVGAIEGDDYD
jgi:hypothetical protein